MNTLLRGTLSLLFLVVLGLILVPVAIAFSLAALTLQLITGVRAPAALLQVADRVACYASQIADYVIMKSDQVPFPVSPFPPPSLTLIVEQETAHEDPAYADADDVTVTEISGYGVNQSATYADGEEDTIINSVAEQDAPSESVRPESGLAADEIDHDNDTLLNQGAQPSRLETDDIEPDDLDETIVNGNETGESGVDAKTQGVNKNG